MLRPCSVLLQFYRLHAPQRRWRQSGVQLRWTPWNTSHLVTDSLLEESGAFKSAGMYICMSYYSIKYTRQSIWPKDLSVHWLVVFSELVFVLLCLTVWLKCLDWLCVCIYIYIYTYIHIHIHIHIYIYLGAWTLRVTATPKQATLSHKTQTK